MKKFLFVWEMGGGFGHVGEMLPIARVLRSRGHEVFLFHVLDPIFFQKRIRIEVQAIGWQSESRYLPLQDDVASVAYWYQTLPSAPLRPLLEKEERVID